MASFPQLILKLSAFGKIRSIQDWSTGLWILPVLSGSSLSQSNLNTLCSNLEPLVNTWWATAKTFNVSSVDYRGINLYAYNAGSSRADLTAFQTRTAVVGTGSGGSLPAYCSAVASMRTVLPGRSGRGRSYCPITSIILGSTDLNYPTANMQTLANAYAALLSSINALAPTGGGVSKLESVVASFTKGVAYTINSVLVDTKPDTQHRREDALDPTGLTSAMVTP